MAIANKLFLCSCVLGITFGNFGFALIAPFFPIEAPLLGMSQSQIATVFASMSVAQLVASPLAGPLATRLGRRAVLTAGASLLAVGGTAFGFGSVLRPVLGLDGLMAMLIGCRLLQGTGSALMVTCLFALLADAFPDAKGKVMGLAEMAGGIGWSVAPPLGGLLYDYGGFLLPFVLLGPLPLVTLAAILLSMPAHVAVAAAEDGEGGGGGRQQVEGCAAVRVWRLMSAGLAVSALLAMVPFISFCVFDLGFTV
eukprot:SAG22_NODE_3653_length_1593_cov_1.744311_1_plen_253_part_00